MDKNPLFLVVVPSSLFTNIYNIFGRNFWNEKDIEDCARDLKFGTANNWNVTA